MFLKWSSGGSSAVSSKKSTYSGLLPTLHHGRIQGGSWGSQDRLPPPPPPPPQTAQLLCKCRSIRISFRIGGLRSMKVTISSFFFWGGGGGGGGEGREGGHRCQRNQNFGGSSASFKWSTTKDSQKLMIYMQFSYSVTPPPQLSFWIRPCFMMIARPSGVDKVIDVTNNTYPHQCTCMLCLA